MHAQDKHPDREAPIIKQPKSGMLGLVESFPGGDLPERACDLRRQRSLGQGSAKRIASARQCGRDEFCEDQRGPAAAKAEPNGSIAPQVRD